MFRKTAVAFTFAIILSLLIVGVAGAITIAVDGVTRSSLEWKRRANARTGFPDVNEATH